jgi:succinate dehydrogenase/fumarate reductase flavoprotein subunit
LSAIQEYDVVVVGFGGAGASAAIAAHDLGARVLLIEKSAVPGGNTRASGGSLRSIAKIETACDFYVQLSEGGTPPEVLRAFVDGVEGAFGFLKALGADLVPFPMPTKKYYPSITTTTYPQFTGAEGLGQRFRVNGEGGGGESLWRVLEKGVRARAIDVWMSSPLCGLSHDAGGRVNGVTVKRAGASVEVRARRGVVLACGGFSYNPAMLRHYLGFEMASFGPPEANTGDALAPVLAVGGDLWHMRAVAATIGYRFDAIAVPVRHIMPGPGFIYVDQSGARYIDETGTDFHALPMEMLDTPGMTRPSRYPSFCVFDEATRLAGPIAQEELTFGRNLGWSSDNRAEVARGLIAKGNDAGELAAALGVDAGILAAAIDDFNRACKAGDDRFGRNTQDMAPLTRGPLYGVPIWPVLVNTQGGPRRDPLARVLDRNGAPIRGLYAAGEFGSIWTELYPGAGNVTEAIVFGRIAGSGAAKADASNSK